MEQPIILFDGVCNLCSGSVQWIIRHDKRGHFKFASLQSDFGKNLVAKYNIDPSLDSVLLVFKSRYFSKSTAALHIAKECNGLWKILFVFIIVPRFFRDWIYNFVAKNRYKWFGKKEECWLPNTDLEARFVE